jgi:catechol 2,3-dioxygenase-like lactoylglutathione lyase family enzyme
MNRPVIAAAIAASSIFTLGAVAAEPAQSKAFIAVIVSDAEASADWYSRVFGLSGVNHLESAEYDIRILDGNMAIVEIIELVPAASDAVEDSKGITKAGFTIDNFDARIAEWRKDGVKFHGRGVVFHDDALKLHSTILEDPDGNLIQVFGKSNAQ